MTTTVLTAEEVELTDPASMVERLTEAITDLAGRAVEQVPLLVLGVLVLVLGLLLVALLHRGVVRATGSQRIDPSVARLVQTITRVVLVLAVLLLALSVMGVDVGSALAALGIAGLAIAFAVQSILENFIAGILILVRRPFRPGDQVQVGDFKGTVLDVNLRVTTLVDFDGEKVLLPNATVFSGPIINTTERGRRRTTVTVGVEYRDDHDAAREVLRDALTAVPGVLDQPPPEVLLVELNSSSVDFVLRYWTEPAEAVVWQVRDRVLAAAKSALEAAGMTIPWPIRTLVLDDASVAALQARPGAVDGPTGG